MRISDWSSDVCSSDLLGTGYRLQPYADYGTAAIGVIATGGLRLSQRLGDWAEINQRVRVETGRHNTFVRQTLGVDIMLQPRLTLQSRLEGNHDSRSEEPTSELQSLKSNYSD